MGLSREVVAKLAERVEAAQREARAITKLTDEFPEMTVDDGYLVQDELRRRAIARGSLVVGYKAGLTSRAKMKQMGVDSASVGFLLAETFRADGSRIAVSELIHPRVEAEVAFAIKATLRGPGCTREQVLAATDYVVPAVEVIDSRYENFRFDLQSVLADNTSASRYVAGGRRRNVADLDLPTLGVELEKNGEIVGTAVAAAVLGHPAEAVAMVVNHLAARGEELPAGSFVMSGGITEAVAVAAGDVVTARIQELGSVTMRFV